MSLSPGLALAAAPSDLDRARQAEQRRIELIDQVAPAVVCIYDALQRGGGSGVVIDPQGYGLTNFHVVAGMLAERRGLGGLNDGQLYDLEVLGVDPTGDVAMFRLHGREQFTHAALGDSDAVQVGDTVMAMGNPFVLSEDHAPTVTMGLVTGVHRYQWGMGNQLIYSDCIQTDAPINPGNSGGPLFNLAGEVIGINGRISVNTRGRFNVGFGYAISTNQIRRFMPGLRAGLLVKHGALQATVDEVDGQGLLFSQVLRPGPAWDVGVRPGDRLLRLAGEQVTTANRVASLLGTFPEDWPLPIEIEREGERQTLTPRLDALDVRLQQPYVPNVDANRAAAVDVLKRLRTAIGLPQETTPQRLAGTAVRTTMSDAGEGRGETLQFVWEPSGDASMTPMHDDGAAGTTVAFGADFARRLVPGVDGGVELPVTDAMAFQAVYLTTHLMRGDAAPVDTIEHAGGDAWHEAVDGMLQERVLDVLQWPLGDHVVARLSFEQGSGLLRRVRVRNLPTGETVTLSVEAWSQQDGRWWPAQTETTTSTARWRDVWSGWEAGK